MSHLDLDDVDRGILHLLQEDARNHVASTIAKEVDVSPNTVRNRIERLEDAGVIEQYLPQINYERAGYQLRVLFVCTVPIGKRETLANEVLGIAGVVEVTEILSGKRNLTIEVVGTDTNDITAIAEQIEELDIDIEDERLMKRVHAIPFDHFGREIVEE